jgi:hypothetical protein
MPHVDRDLFLQLWTAAKAQQQPADADLARIQKFMIMHEEWHELFEQAEKDPSVPLEIQGTDLIFQIGIEAATEKSLELDTPAGVRKLMQTMLDIGFPPLKAFTVLARAMYDESQEAIRQGQSEMDTFRYFARAQQYMQQALHAQ